MFAGIVCSSLLLVLLGARTTTARRCTYYGINYVRAQDLARKYENESSVLFPQLMQASWDYIVNMTDETRAAKDAIFREQELWGRQLGQRAASIDISNIPSDLKRQVSTLRNFDSAALDDATLEWNHNVASAMENMPLDQRLGPRMRAVYKDYINVSNIIAENKGFGDYGAYLRRASFEIDTLEAEAERLYQELLPFYKELHAFIKRRLKLLAGTKSITSSGHFIEDFLGFAHYTVLTSPYPSKTIPDVTSEMLRQNYTVERMFRVADDFFVSLGFSHAPQEFWDESIFEEPLDGRQFTCQPMARDFYNGRDFRISGCFGVNHFDFVTAHHEMGHVQYYLQYKHLPNIYRRGANPAFHEAVGDLISLSVNTKEHLNRLGLLPTLDRDPEVDINFLFQQALSSKVLELPDMYRADYWVWRVFRGEIQPDQYNHEWSQFSCRLRGVIGAENPNEDDFHPGEMYQVSIGMSVMKYFLSNILKFQFHKALCEAAGHQGPLHTCDIYNSAAAGQKLRAMLSTGMSKMWTVPFERMTGTTRMSAQPMLEYFQPLIDYLHKENSRDKGWEPECAPLFPCP